MNNDGCEPTIGDVRYFVDENLAGLGLSLMRLRRDIAVGGWGPIRQLVPALDEDWIPVVAAHGWTVITNDKKLRTRPNEAALTKAHRLLHLTPPVRDAPHWEFARVLLRHWDTVEAVAGETGPLWLAVSKRGCTRKAFAPGQVERMPPADR
ncbi:hypothetical protein JOD54_000341 [Actinokineospora baliensis]|uniref:PIN-like domain-containing protein n=1 Tax=Actinokineospora baliensis TaxID=547056 RepID=UPI00195B101B|nr:hypothetical protein [Actinokineospora baliensis]MBM7770137.1 hypothetical protein [Actinokineospora baliensis]